MAAAPFLTATWSNLFLATYAVPTTLEIAGGDKRAPMGAATLSREELASHQADRVLNAAISVFASPTPG